MTGIRTAPWSALSSEFTTFTVPRWALALRPLCFTAAYFWGAVTAFSTGMGVVGVLVGFLCCALTFSSARKVGNAWAQRNAPEPTGPAIERIDRQR